MKLKRKIYGIVISVLFILSFGGTSYARSKPVHNPPIPPTGLTVTSISTSEIDLSWAAVSGASDYKIFSATPNDSSYTQIATLSGTAYKHTGLKASSTYCYFVRAYNSYGISIDSTHVSTSTLNPPIINTSKFVLGFTTYYYSGDSSTYNSIVNNTTSLNQIATDTYTTDGLGNTDYWSTIKTKLSK
jgi:spore germination protein YaaH